MKFKTFLNNIKILSIYLCMMLNDCKKNKILRVLAIYIDDEKLKLRLYEIGFFKYSQIEILAISFFKKTLLVKVLDSCFAIKSDVASKIEVEYV